MTRKRRVSEAAVVCNARDPLNLKSVATGSYAVDESTANVPTDAELCIPDSAGDGFFHSSNISIQKQAEDLKTRQESLSKNKLLPSFTTPPRLIRPLLVRNPKDPLDLFSSNCSEVSTISVTRVSKVPSPVTAPIVAKSGITSSSDAPNRPTNNRKRRRYRSAVLASEGDVQHGSLANEGERKHSTSHVSSPVTIQKNPPAKKQRRCRRRKRRRRHGIKKTEASSKKEPKNVPPLKKGVLYTRFACSPLSLPHSSSLYPLCTPIRSIFSECDVLHIGACGDNGIFSVQLATQFGASRVLGIDRCMKRIKVARRQLGSFTGQLSLAEQRASDKSVLFPRGFTACFGPIGPDICSPITNAMLSTIEFVYVSDYASISTSVLAGNESPTSPSWDTIILQESVIASILCNPGKGPAAVHRLFCQISSSLRPGGHLLLVLGRLRWQKLLKLRCAGSRQHLEPSNVSTSAEETFPAEAKLHPLTQLRKFFRFRLVRRLSTSFTPTRIRRPSSVSWRGISPYQSRNSRHHSQSHVRCQSATFLQAGCLATNNSESRMARRYGGSHRIVFVLQKKGTEACKKAASHPRNTSEPVEGATIDSNLATSAL